MVFFAVFLFVILQRLIELAIARQNERRLLAQGAYEVGAQHYPWMILLHVSFLVSFLVEANSGTLQMGWLLFFIMLQFARIWCLVSLGVFWNTKIIILPGAEQVRRGPYAWLRHPNYIVVSLELIALPLMFEAYFTAVLFTVLNAWMLSVRIPIENRALTME